MKHRSRVKRGRHTAPPLQEIGSLKDLMPTPDQREPAGTYHRDIPMFTPEHHPGAPPRRRAGITAV